MSFHRAAAGPGMQPQMIGQGMSAPMPPSNHPVTVSAPPVMRPTNSVVRYPRASHLSSSQGNQLIQGGTIPGQPTGPPVTVFVGNITERAPDILVRQMLHSCGQLIAWKRVQGASGKLQAFGFCEFSNPDSGLRAIRLLHDFQLGDKKLVVKVDAKTKNIMFRFKGDKKRELRGEEAAPPAPEGTEEEDTPDVDYMSEEMKQRDDAVRINTT